MRNPIVRFCILALSSFLFLAFIRFGYYSFTEGFSLKRIENTIQDSPELKQKPPTSFEVKKIQALCSKPFRYLKKGSQAYAFQSADGNYILKLYKCHHLHPADWLYDVPTPSFLESWRNRLIERRRYKRNLTISSFVLAKTTLKKECGILYSQVLPESTYSIQATLIDAIGRTYKIDLAKYGFALQRKAQLVFPSLSSWIQSGDIESAKKALASLIGLMAARSKKGIQDSDPDLHKNAGLIGTDAIFIDIGSFHSNPKICERDEMKRDIQKISRGLLSWLENKNPELHAYLLTLLEAPWNVEWNPPKEM